MSEFPALISRYNSMEKTSNSVLVHGEEKTYERHIKIICFMGNRQPRRLVTYCLLYQFVSQL